MIIKILRQDDRQSEPYRQTFAYEPDGRQTVSHIIDKLNYADDLFDIDGNPARRIKWDCSCRQKMCGSCAMVINGKPALACSTFIDTDKTKVLKLEPLSKFPTVCDLSVDRSSIAEHQKAAMLFIKEAEDKTSPEQENRYSLDRCIKCGLCLEICPNYVRNDGEFYGAVFANEAFSVFISDKGRRGEIMKEYGKHFHRGCSGSLACRDICPMRINTLSSIGYLNRGRKK